MVAVKDLTTQQETFVKEYLTNGGNGTKAFIKARYGEAGPPKGMKDQQLRKRASELIRHPKVAHALKLADKRKLERVSNAMSKYEITQERIAEELAKIAFGDIRDVMEWGDDGVKLKPSSDLSNEAAATIAEVSETRNDKTGTTVKLKQHDRVVALEKLGRMLGMFTEKHEHQHKHLSVNFVIEGKDG